MDLNWDWMKSALYQAYTVVYIFGGVVPYVPQYLELKRLNSIRGFSTYVCLTLLVANILRICFWFVQPFSAPLLVQSVIMVVAMLVLMHRAALILRAETHPHSPPLSGRAGLVSTKSTRTVWNGPLKYFWQWTEFSSYLTFTGVFTVLASTVTHLCGQIPLFVQLLGFTALFTEALLGLPQLIKNYQNGSTKGMSIMMVFMWTVGDVAKSVFFMLEDAPLQFPLCGWLQVLLDVVIFTQHFYYTYLKQ